MGATVKLLLLVSVPEGLYSPRQGRWLLQPELEGGCREIKASDSPLPDAVAPLVTKLRHSSADTNGMEGRYIEPRKVLWAVAEITGNDTQNRSFRVPAVLEDTSDSGACLRVKCALAVGSWINVKWHREQFSAVTRSCRSDGGEFLIGVKRVAEKEQGKNLPAPSIATPTPSAGVVDKVATQPRRAAPKVLRPLRPLTVAIAEQEAPRLEATNQLPAHMHHRTECTSGPVLEDSRSPARTESHSQSTLSRPERTVMEPKNMFSHFWRRKNDSRPDEDAPTTMEVTVNKPSTPGSTPSGPRSELLGYEDIYRASGIMSPGSGYGIHKVVDMLNSDRLHDLSNEAKCASVLMALDAAGISVDDLQSDATRRQNALIAYESSQVQQLEAFEAGKTKENSRIEQEMEKIRIHYAERIQANLDQVAKEKEALRNWQMAMQHETQRIREVLALCGKQATPVKEATAMAAAAGAQGTETPKAAADAARSVTLRPTLPGGS